MQTNESRPQPFDTLLKAIAYLMGGIFLYTAKVTGTPVLGAQVLGVIFIVFAFFLVIASFFNRFRASSRRVDSYLLLGLFSATVARVIIAGVESRELFYVVFAFLVLMLGVFLFHIFRSTRELASNVGNRCAAIRTLRILSLILALFGFMMVIMQQNLYGGPVLYLALALILLNISLLLKPRSKESNCAPQTKGGAHEENQHSTT